MKLNQACRLLVGRVDELTAEAERVKDALIVLLMDPAALNPGQQIEASFGDAAVSIGEGLHDVSERLRRLTDVIMELQAMSPSAQVSMGFESMGFEL
jgi:hypothetical protein